MLAAGSLRWSTLCLAWEHARSSSRSCDQQDVVVWFLYLTPWGGGLVIGSPEGDIDAVEWEELHDGVRPNAVDMAILFADARICAPSFEAFIYRFWMESTLFHKLHGFDGTPLTSQEHRYLAHYEPMIDASGS